MKAIKTEDPTWGTSILQTVNYLGGVARLGSIYFEIKRERFMDLKSNHLKVTSYGNRPAFQHQVRSSIFHLMKSNDLIRKSRGIYAITPEGINRIKNIKFKKKRYNIPVTWSCTGTISVKAKSIEDAIVKAEDSSLPKGEYISGSFEVDVESPLMDKYFEVTMRQ